MPICVSFPTSTQLLKTQVALGSVVLETCNGSLKNKLVDLSFYLPFATLVFPSLLKSTLNPRFSASASLGLMSHLGPPLQYVTSETFRSLTLWY